MIIIIPDASAENVDFVEYLEENTSFKVLLFKSYEQCINEITKEEIHTDVCVIFINNKEEFEINFKVLKDKIKLEKNSMFFYMGIIEAELEVYKRFFNEHLDTILIKPVTETDILKEITKGEKILSSFENQLNGMKNDVENIDHLIKEKAVKENRNKEEMGKDKSKSEKSKDEERENLTSETKLIPKEPSEYLFDQAVRDIKKTIDEIKENKNIGHKIYERVVGNIVWPGKVLIKNFDINNDQFKENYFTHDKVNDNLIAKYLGFIEKKYNQIEFIPITYLTKDLMSAYGYIFPIPDISQENSIQHFLDDLKNYEITYGIDNDKIKDKVGLVIENKTIEYIKLAQGLKPTDGYTEYNEIMIHKEKKIGEITDDLGTIDYREHSDLINVKKGDEIAKRIVAKDPENGCTIKGEQLSGQIFPKKSIVIGENLVLDEEKNIFYSKSDGMLVFEGDTIHVKETLVVNGDVSLKTGNIHSNKNVFVKGNVTAGMVIEAKGNIIIEGIIEDAKIISDGNIKVHGISGTGNSWLFSKGNLEFDFCQNSHLEALGNIIFHKYAINSEVYSNKKIVGLDNSKFMGGLLEAAKGCDLFILGNLQEVPTKVILGVNFFNQKIVSKIYKRLNELKLDKQELISILKDSVNFNLPLKPQIEKMNERDSKTVINRVKDLKQKHNLIIKLQKSLDKSAKDVQKEIGAKLIIKNKIFAGSEIEIASVKKKLKEEYHKGEFVLAIKKMEIIYLPY